EYGATPYAGDAYFGDWPRTLGRLEALAPESLVPGRGDALIDAKSSAAAIAGTREFVATMLDEARRAVAAKKSLKSTFDAVHAKMEPHYGKWVIFEHCLPFDVSRAYDEASGIADPRVWTAERDLEMWEALQSAPPAQR